MRSLFGVATLAEPGSNAAGDGGPVGTWSLRERDTTPRLELKAGQGLRLILQGRMVRCPTYIEGAYRITARKGAEASVSFTPRNIRQKVRGTDRKSSSDADLELVLAFGRTFKRG